MTLWLAVVGGCAADPPASIPAQEPSVFDVPEDRDRDGAIARADGGDDCDDTDPNVHPGATPACGGGTDDDCDGALDAIDADTDGDAFTPCAGDCDDGRADVHPGSTEVCGGEVAADEDCDGALDAADPDHERYSCGWCPTEADAAALATEDLVLEAFDPCTLDPSATYHCGGSDDPRLHRVLYRKDLPLRDETFVWFPPGPGIWNDKIRTWAALAGYRVLSVAFWNEGLPAQACDQIGGSCWYDVRTEVMTGADTWPQAQILPADALEVRLRTLISHLAATEPDVGWGRHLGPPDPATGVRPLLWDELVVAGWSEGSGYAALAAHEHAVRAALLFSGPYDADLSAASHTGAAPPLHVAAPAAWLLAPSATPPSAVWGVVHLYESQVYIVMSWEALGILGDPVVIEESAPPYAGSHWFTTALADWRKPDCRAHKSVAMDYCMDDGLFLPYVTMFCAAARPRE